MDRSKEKSGHENKQLVDTVKALIALYKSAFGNDWKQAYTATVRTNLTGV
jgi:hypothetical protein